MNQPTISKYTYFKLEVPLDQKRGKNIESALKTGPHPFLSKTEKTKKVDFRYEIQFSNFRKKLESRLFSGLLIGFDRFSI
jgi:hypothetical protein